MAEMTMVESIRHTLDQEMERDPKIVLLGEDIGVNGGVFRVTEGLIKKYGPERVIDTPLSESGVIGFATGMALYGLHPIPEIQFVDFIWPGWDQIMSELSKFRYRSGGQFPAHLVIRAPYGGGVGGALYHSQSPEAYFAHTPGLKVVIPSGPRNAKGLLLSAIRDSNPVIFMEPKRIYRAFREDVPEDDFTIPLGEASVAREGDDVTIISYGSMLHKALETAERVQSEQDISCEVIDLRTLLPLDIDAIERSVRKTGRVLSVTEDTRTSGFGAELSALIAERLIEYLEAPIVRVTGFDTPFPLVQEQDYLPSVARIQDSVLNVYNFSYGGSTR
ncbi:MAG: alpha-ketoacid dehydrogenase subunit beta [Promethearchaeota archaeon]